MKAILVAATLFFVPFAYANETHFPASHTPNSEFVVDYSDLDLVLSSAVLDMGPSTHKRAHRVRADSATRLYGGSRKPSRFEGNRVVFHLFRDEHRQILQAIRDGLLALPQDIALDELSRNEQLAYFLNLHNSIVLVKMAEEYPVTDLERFFDRDRPASFINSDTFSWNGKDISLADIQDHVLSNWQDPMVIYGFYMGAVGTPNIRSEAFHGSRVYDQLRANARDFVNSVRGTQIWNGSELRVASYYRRMAVKFPNFDADVMRHVKQYARPNFATKLVAVNTVDARIDDWNIADLYNGHLHQAGRTGPRTITDAEGTLLGQPNIPLHVVHTLRGRINNFKRFEGTVDIEEVSAGEPEPTEEADTTDADKDDQPA